MSFSQYFSIQYFRINFPIKCLLVTILTCYDQWLPHTQLLVVLYICQLVSKKNGYVRQLLIGLRFSMMQCRASYGLCQLISCYQLHLVELLVGSVSNQVSSVQHTEQLLAGSCQCWSVILSNFFARCVAHSSQLYGLWAHIFS